ncbi:hypothetical protein ACQJBY_032661 [Aegilops geniculata]
MHNDVCIDLPPGNMHGLIQHQGRLEHTPPFICLESIKHSGIDEFIYEVGRADVRNIIFIHNATFLYLPLPGNEDTYVGILCHGEDITSIWPHHMYVRDGKLLSN